MEGSKSKRAVARQFAPTRLSEQWQTAAYEDALAASQHRTVQEAGRRNQRSARGRKRPPTMAKTGGLDA